MFGNISSTTRRIGTSVRILYAVCVGHKKIKRLWRPKASLENKASSESVVGDKSVFEDQKTLARMYLCINMYISICIHLYGDQKTLYWYPKSKEKLLIGLVTMIAFIVTFDKIKYSNDCSCIRNTLAFSSRCI